MRIEQRAIGKNGVMPQAPSILVLSCMFCWYTNWYSCRNCLCSSPRVLVYLYTPMKENMRYRCTFWQEQTWLNKVLKQLGKSAETKNKKISQIVNFVSIKSRQQVGKIPRTTIVINGASCIFALRKQNVCCWITPLVRWVSQQSNSLDCNPCIHHSMQHIAN